MGLLMVKIQYEQESLVAYCHNKETVPIKMSIEHPLWRKENYYTDLIQLIKRIATPETFEYIEEMTRIPTLKGNLDKFVKNSISFKYQTILDTGVVELKSLSPYTKARLKISARWVVCD